MDTRQRLSIVLATVIIGSASVGVSHATLGRVDSRDGGRSGRAEGDEADTHTHPSVGAHRRRPDL